MSVPDPALPVHGLSQPLVTVAHGDKNERAKEFTQSLSEEDIASRLGRMGRLRETGRSENAEACVQMALEQF